MEHRYKDLLQYTQQVTLPVLKVRAERWYERFVQASTMLQGTIEPDWSYYNTLQRDNEDFETDVEVLITNIKGILQDVRDICNIYKAMCLYPVDPADPVRLNFQICNMKLYAHKLRMYIDDVRTHSQMEPAPTTPLDTRRYALQRFNQCYHDYFMADGNGTTKANGNQCTGRQ